MFPNHASAKQRFLCGLGNNVWAERRRPLVLEYEVLGVEKVELKILRVTLVEVRAPLGKIVLSLPQDDERGGCLSRNRPATSDRETGCCGSRT
jgi:hypothetical protein